MMAPPFLDRLITNVAFYCYGVFSLLLYVVLVVRSGEMFRKLTEKDNLLYAIGEHNYPSPPRVS